MVGFSFTLCRYGAESDNRLIIFKAFVTLALVAFLTGSFLIGTLCQAEIADSSKIANSIVPQQPYQLLQLAQAETNPKNNSSVKDEVQEKIKALFAVTLPDAKVKTIESTSFRPLYQVVLDTGEMVYVSADGNFVLTGDLWQKQQSGQLYNITDAYRSRQRAQMLHDIKTDEMVIYVPEDTPRSELYVFTDTDCGYCRKFHQEIPSLINMGVQVNYLAWPRAGVNSATGRTMVKIWCSDNKQSAMDDAKSGRKVTTNLCDQHGIDKQLILGQRLGVRGTPAIFLSDGRKIGGYRSAQQIAIDLGL